MVTQCSVTDDTLLTQYVYQVPESTTLIFMIRGGSIAESFNYHWRQRKTANGIVNRTNITTFLGFRQSNRMPLH